MNQASFSKDKLDESLIIEQLDEALEEREGRDRRKKNAGNDPQSGEDRRKGDRRNAGK